MSDKTQLFFKKPVHQELKFICKFFCKDQSIISVLKQSIKSRVFPALFPVLGEGRAWKKTRETPELYALFKHTYKAQIFSKKFTDIV